MRIFLIFFLMMLTVLSGSYRFSNEGKVLPLAARSASEMVSYKSPTIQDESEKTCHLTDREIKNAIRRFRGNTTSVAQEAYATKAILLDKSKESSVCRNKIIKALMKAMDKPNLDFVENPDSYFLWRYGAVLLGELKASEAIDLLIKHLTLKWVLVSLSSMRHQPALLGVVEMGSIAIPKLTEVLQHNPDKEMRYWAVWSIATIGGVEAVRSLRESLDSETDKCVKAFISISLNYFNNEGRIKNRLGWYAETEAKCSK